MAGPPSGTVTFLFTDVEGSTRRWEVDPRTMATAVERHLAILDSAIQDQGGVHFKTVGDAVQAAFPTATQAVVAAVNGQLALLAEQWPFPEPLRIRMALHAGEATPDERGDYLAAPLNRLSRLLGTAYGGQIVLSQTVQQLTRGSLPPDVALLDLGEHRLRDLLEPERVFQLLHPDLPAQFPPLRSLARRPNNLPVQPTPLLGRERDVRQIVELLRRPEVRFVTLTGPGGTGKTRLALQASVELLDDFSDGVYFVPLAPLTDPALVPSTIAATLGIREESDQAVRSRLQSALATKALLLVLDNVEHVTAAAPVLAELLETSPGVEVLATSRTPLRLRAEWEFEVAPLDVPRRHPPPTLAELSQSPAVRLFVERAQAVRSDFAIDAELAPAVAEIVLRLDGLPLAIELAASRIRMLSPQAILARLEQRLPFLTAGARDAPERQRTLRNTIAWSYDLLHPDEQQAFRQLAVFSGGFTLEGTEAIASAGGHGDSFASVEKLVEQSLIRQSADSGLEPRFSMLETIREFGLEQLEASGELDSVRGRHAAYMLAMATAADQALHGPGQARWMEQLGIEYDNIRATLGWTLDHEPETSLRLVAALFWFWFYRGYLTEGRDWTERALASHAGGPPEVRARALNWASNFAWERADYATASARAEEALALARSVGDRSAEGWALMSCAAIASGLGDWKASAAYSAEAEEQFRGGGERHGVAAALVEQGVQAGIAGDIERRQAYLQRSLAESRAIGDRMESSLTLSTLGLGELELGHLAQAQPLLEEALATAREFRFGKIEARAMLALAELASDQGDVERAKTYLHDAESRFRELGDGLSLATGLNHLGYLELLLGNAEVARRYIEEAISLARQHGAPSVVAGYVHSLGDVLRSSGDTSAAAAQYLEALALGQQVQDDTIITACLMALAGLAADTGRLEMAARLFGVVEALRETVGQPGSHYEAERLTEDMMAVRAALGNEAEAAARAAGRALPLQAALDEALTLADAMISGAATPA